MKTIKNFANLLFNKRCLLTVTVLTLWISAGSFSCVKRERTSPRTQLSAGAKEDAKATDPAAAKKNAHKEEATDSVDPPDERKDVLKEWTSAYKASIVKLHSDIEECSDDDPDDPAAPYECACRLVCNSVFPRPPAGGTITVRYPLHGVSGFSITIDKDGKAASCSYSSTGENGVDLNMVCRPKT